MYWTKLSHSTIKSKVFGALSNNTNYNNNTVFGIPASSLDDVVFYDDAPFLKDAPFLSCLVANPNHIGVHTLSSEHEDFFAGTQAIEKDLIRICAEELFHAEPNSYDGYVASGGTEGNIEAIWIYRNYFIEEFKAKPSEIAIVSSCDTHYSVYKAGNLLQLKNIILDVHEQTRLIDIGDLESKIYEALKNGINYFIVNLNMATTMFGSVDDIETITNFFNLLKLNYKLHIDGAYGGFIYPFTNPDSPFKFSNPNISSFSIDGHKLLQAPYGTGIFLIRKEHLKFVCTNEAHYVKGKDYTLCGSRSGANAICVWMILKAHGSEGWSLKMNNLIALTNEFCNSLDDLSIQYYRNPFVNIVAIPSKFIHESIAIKYNLVPDAHHDPKWYKIIVMPHVKSEMLHNFVHDLKKTLYNLVP
jgi:tyrosine decarboxylase / aspartate 1-decarboxylase